MDVKIVINVKETTQEDIRGFVQMVREWELRTPQAKTMGVLFDTNPAITTAEAKAIFEGIFTEFESLVEMPGATGPILRLGTRGIVVQGQLVGTCEELTLSIGEATEQEILNLQDAHTISLVRPGGG